MKEPSLLVPYPGPDASGNSFDIYVYLRPETNGVLTESVIMKTVLSDPVWAESVKLVYLANYPGDFIKTRHLIEHHYRMKVFFAREGGNAFTPGMKKAFEKGFGVPFNSSKVLGAFDAMSVCGMDEEDMFGYHVDEEDMLVVLAQNIKHRGDIWIVNYDIPALLHKNDSETDIAVMVFRSFLPWPDFTKLIEAMGVHLIEAGLLRPETALSRAFHYSRSPWEQLLDGVDYLWGVDVSDGGAEDDISFGAYMMSRSYSREFLKDTIRHPLVEYRDSSESEETREGNIFEMSAGMDYAHAEALLKCIVRQLPLRHS